MALPPHFLDELRARLTLSEVVGRKVTWDRRKSNASRGDWWAPCPFHQEKTPSFHVDDRKGFYYCFGCHAKGDAITFVKEAENLSFMEAVERLAAEAGLEMPERRADPQAAERRDRAARLADVMEQAVQAFRLAFRSARGQGAQAYARGRGLSADTLARFEIGYAPDSRTHLTETFRGRGLLEEAVEAGLVIRPEDGGAPYDRFRDRLIFPIRDPRGRCIALGGRALSPHAKAKYLNSPETVLFHKGRTLYNHGPAREAAGRSGRLVVAEGYMDVIALAAHGIEHAVAPLGTAVTGEQLDLLWRMAPEPVIALDGDAAGLRAAHRLIDLALPRLGPGRSLGFCLLPQGTDPDDILRDGGRAAMEALLGDALPLVEMLWRREAEATPLDTPERRAALRARLAEATGRIGDPVLRRFYEDGFARRMRELFWRLDCPAGARAGRGRRDAPAGPATPTRSSALARTADRAATRRAREATILLIALRNPAALGPVEAALEDMPVLTPEFEAIRARLLAHAGGDAPDPPLAAGDDPALLLETEPLARAHPQARAGADPERVAAVLGEAIARHAALCGREAELSEAARDLAEAEGEDWTWRVRQAGLACLALDAQALRAEEERGSQDRPSLISELIERHRSPSRASKKSGPPSSNQ
jgi:DNA primase